MFTPVEDYIAWTSCTLGLNYETKFIVIIRWQIVSLKIELRIPLPLLQPSQILVMFLWTLWGFIWCQNEKEKKKCLYCTCCTWHLVHHVCNTVVSCFCCCFFIWFFATSVVVFCGGLFSCTSCLSGFPDSELMLYPRLGPVGVSQLQCTARPRHVGSIFHKEILDRFFAWKASCDSIALPSLLIVSCLHLVDTVFLLQWIL